MSDCPQKMVANYVISQRGVGAFLAFEDHEIISKWLSISPDPLTVILALDNIITNVSNTRKRKLRLSYFDARVTKAISK